jgi:hypothetical protein
VSKEDDEPLSNEEDEQPLSLLADEPVSVAVALGASELGALGAWLDEESSVMAPGRPNG